MAKQKTPEPVMTPVTYTQEEVDYREDLLQKLLTLDHVKSVLIGRDDAPHFIAQIDSLRNIILQWMTAQAKTKRVIPDEQTIAQENPEPEIPDGQ